LHLPSPSPLEKRIKRRVIAREQEFFAVAPPGIESLTQGELAALGLGRGAPAVETGGVTFSGPLHDGYKANLCLRTATRVLMRIETYKAADFTSLEKHWNRIPWELYLPPDATPQLRVSCRKSRLYHSDAVAQRLQAALAQNFETVDSTDGLPAAADPDSSPPPLLFVRLLHDRCTVSLDSSGEALYRRGLKTQVTEAPLRENLAAAILMLAGYDGRQPLMDPMCGSGTFSIEAAMMAADIPAGWYRPFAFFAWPAYHLNQGRWVHLRRQAQIRFRIPERPQIFASDIDPEACGMLSANLAGIEPAPAVAINVADFFSLRPAGDTGVVVLNPPYGRRIDAGREGHLYREIGEKLQKDFRNWTAAVIIPDRQLLREIPFAVRVHPLVHGGLKVWVAIGKIR
jgi:putative N6-adenine-specific DNA methylase